MATKMKKKKAKSLKIFFSETRKGGGVSQVRNIGTKKENFKILLL